VSEQFFDAGAAAARERAIPVWRWTLWYVCLAMGMVVFYVLLTPLWLGLRWAAWIAEFSARRRRPSGAGPPATRVTR
jgi:hypothetical protein